MATDAVLRGYLLEESLAWLLRFSGYRLLVHEDQDPGELVDQEGALPVSAPLYARAEPPAPRDVSVACSGFLALAV